MLIKLEKQELKHEPFNIVFYWVALVFVLFATIGVCFSIIEGKSLIAPLKLYGFAAIFSLLGGYPYKLVFSKDSASED